MQILRSMNKRAVITISIVSAILAIVLILFCAVFRVRYQTIDFVGERVVTNTITNKEIKSSANIKNGSSIFLIDKDSATNNIESTYPYLKVIQIKTKSVITIQFRLRERVPMYYAEFNANYYIMDEDLKVLDISTTQPTMTRLNIDSLDIDSDTKAGDFVGSKYEQQVMSSLFIAMYNVAKINDEYLDRDDIKTFMLDISFDKGYTLSKSYNRLIVTTSYGVKLDIAEPNKDLEHKVNVLMSAFNELTDTQKSSGILKYYFSSTDEAKAGYFEE